MNHQKKWQGLWGRSRQSRVETSGVREGTAPAPGEASLDFSSRWDLGEAYL